MPFELVTYNILADAYLNPDWYRQVDPELLKPARRRAALLQRLSGLSADLLCLQEVESGAFDAISAHLGPMGYASSWMQKTHGRPDGCAMFWRADLLRQETGHLLVYPDAPPGGRDSGHIAQGVTFIYRGGRLGVINTHLRWDDPVKPGPERWCYRQAEALKPWLRELPTVEGWVVCGDLNVGPRDVVLATLRGGGLRDAFDGADEPHTCLANGRKAKIDHILHTSGLEVLPRGAPSLAGVTALPSASEPSDHVPLRARVDFQI